MDGILTGNNYTKMNNKYNLFEILQNPTIGVIAIHSFVLGYTAITYRQNELLLKNPKLNYLFYILPIIYGKSSLKSFKTSRELYTAISKDKGVSLGLQERANKMSSQTFESLNLGFSKYIFRIDKNTMTVSIADEYSKKSILTSMKISDDYLKDIRKASFQLGNIFAKKDKKMLQLMLDIRF